MRRFPQRLSIRAGLVLLALLAVLPALALQVYDGVKQRRHLVDDATMEARRAVAAMAQSQTRITESTRLLLATLAAMPEVKQLHTAACGALFASLLNDNPLYINILAVDRHGDIFASGLPFGRVNLADRKHLIEAMHSGRFSVGEYIVSRTGYDAAFPFAMPFRDENGQIAGALIAAIKLSHFDDAFDRMLMPQGSVLGITDHQGIRLYYRPKSPTNPPGAPIREEVWKAVSTSPEDQGVMLLPGSDGFKRFYAFERLSLGPGQPPYMYFVVGLPESAVLGAAREALAGNLFFLATSALLALCVAWFFGGPVIARRLDRLADTAGRIGQGDFAARTGLLHGESGIAKVAKNLDAMAALLAAHDAAREQALAALRQSQERMGHIASSMADWIFETDGEDRYVYISEKVARTLGYEPGALLGKTPFDFLAPGEEDAFRTAFAQAKAARAPIRDLTAWRATRNGDKRCVLTSAVPWHDETGAFKGYRGVDRDVTASVRAQQELRDSLAEKDILLKEIHHRVKNNLQIISGLLYLQEERVQDPAALESFRESRSRIASMALVHEELYRSNDLARVRLDHYIQELLPRLFGHDQKTPVLAYDCRLASVDVPIEKAVPAGLALNELLTNTYKHAFQDRPAGILRLRLLADDEAVTVVVGDDGPGLPPDFDLEAAGTLGMQLVANLTRQLGGEVHAANDAEGAVFTLRFPR